MKRTTYLWGLKFGLAWLGLGLLFLYAIARIAASPPNLQWLCMLWLMAMPLIAGFKYGWQYPLTAFKMGFSLFPLFLMAIAIIWWWLWPDLWHGGLFIAYSCYVCLLAAFCAGLGSGFRLAYHKVFSG